MKRLLALLVLCLPLHLFAQGFGSFSHDQPFFAKDITAGGGYTPYIQSGLVAYWRLDELTGGGTNTVFHDEINDFFNKVTMSSSSACVSQSGIITNSILFDGSASVGVRCNDNGLLSWNTNKTFTLWYYPTNSSVAGVILSKINSGANLEYTIETSPTAATMVLQPTGGSLVTVTASQPVFRLNEWNFIAAQIDAINKKIRIRVATNSVMGSWYTNTYTGATNDNIGSFGFGSDGTATKTVRGKIDEVTHWTNLITDTQITNLMNLTAPFN